MIFIIPYLPLFLKGAVVTCIAWLLAGCTSIVVGTLLGILSSPRVGSSMVIMLIKMYTFIAKGIPAYVQILICYFVIPAVLGIQVSGFFAATIALAFSSSGYVVEIIRSGFNAIPRGQWDASFVLGYNLPETIKRIMIPQVFRVILPALIGELEQLLKSTSLLATIGVTEITRVGMNIISRELNPLPVYGMIAFIYLLFSALLGFIMRYAERKTSYDYNQ